MRKQLCLRLAAILLIAVLILPLSSCGLLLYPERRGQTSGEIDVGVAILDGIGVLFFVIPGLIAFAVDFSTGCIYLPPDHNRDTKTPRNTRTALIQLSPDVMTRDNIESVLAEQIGQPVDLTRPDVRVYRYKGNV